MVTCSPAGMSTAVHSRLKMTGSLRARYMISLRRDMLVVTRYGRLQRVPPKARALYPTREFAHAGQRRELVVLLDPVLPWSVPHQHVVHSVEQVERGVYRGALHLLGHD